MVARKPSCDCTAERRCDVCAEADFRELHARCKGPKYRPYPIDSPRPEAREGLHKPRGVLIPSEPVKKKTQPDDGESQRLNTILGKALEDDCHCMAMRILARNAAIDPNGRDAIRLRELQAEGF